MTWIDGAARSIYGMSGAEFEAAYAVGAFPSGTVADDLGSVLPVIKRLRARQPAATAAQVEGT